MIRSKPAWSPRRIAAELRRRKGWVWGVRSVLLIAASSILLDHCGSFGFAGDDFANFNHRDARIVASIAGDSVLIQPADSAATTPVRLIGVASLNSNWDSQSQHWLDKNLSNRSITLLLGPTQTRDPQGRLLAYVFLNEHDNASADLVKAGLALADRRTPYALHGAVEEAESDARKKRLGLWATATDSIMPAWRQQWLATLRGHQPKILRTAMGN